MLNNNERKKWEKQSHKNAQAQASYTYVKVSKIEYEKIQISSMRMCFVLCVYIIERKRSTRSGTWCPARMYSIGLMRTIELEKSQNTRML